jgi:hypothetical protein
VGHIIFTMPCQAENGRNILTKQVRCLIKMPG